MRFKKVILITIDSLRADYSSTLHYFVRKALGSRYIFKTIIANGPGTPQSFPSILASSSFLLLNRDFTIPKHMITLPEILINNGYVTIGIHSNPYLSKVFHWNRGFRLFHEYQSETRTSLHLINRVSILRNIASKMLRNEQAQKYLIPRIKNLYQLIVSMKNKNPPYLDAAKISNKAIKILRLFKNDNMFLWVHYMDTHWPYNVPKPKLLNVCNFNTVQQALRFMFRIPISFISPEDSKNINKDDLDRLKCLYNMSIIYTFENIQRILLELVELDIINETLIVITSDHGEAFLEHGSIGHPFYSLYNENLFVPLLIWLPFEGVEANIPKQHRELAPFILKTLSIRSFPKTWLGIKPLASDSVFSESAYVDPFTMRIYKKKYIISVIHNEYKLIIDNYRENIELYNLKKDFHEKNNIVNEPSDIVAELKDKIERYRLLLRTIPMHSKLKLVRPKMIK